MLPILILSEHGIPELQNLPHPGKPVVYRPKVRIRILTQLEQPHPKGLSRWNGGAQALGVERHRLEDPSQGRNPIVLTLS
jgi:hypothetical protein